jgi:signal transduction histidine kinase
MSRTPPRRLLPVRGVRVGLRGRVVAATTAIAVVTLLVAGVGLLGPLEASLRHRELQGLRDRVLAERAALRTLRPSDLRPADPGLLAIARALHRRARARVLIVGPTGKMLAAIEPLPGESLQDVRRALLTGRVQQRAEGAQERGEARVAVPVRAGGERIVVAVRRPLQDVGLAYRTVRRALLPAAGVGLAMALLLSMAVSLRLVRRLRALRDTALRVAELGQPVRVERDDGHDEVGDLTRAFARMQRRLDEQEEARHTFVATASHELRTPLTSLRLMLDLLREELDAPQPDLDAARRQAEGADGQARRLGALASQLLDLSRIDAGVPVRAEPVDLPALCGIVLAEVDTRARDCGVRPRLSSGAGGFAVGDPDAVTQILRILLDNALRYGPAGTPVDVDVVPDGARVQVAVRDRGPGVATEERARIFERFTRGSARGTAADAAGFGLGLSIGRELARRMGGDLRLDTVPEPGATFRLVLPATRPAGLGQHGRLQ